MFVWVTPAWAYIDPATTTYIIQVAAAIVITLGVSLSIFLYRFRIIITNLRVTLHALTSRLRNRDTKGKQQNPATISDTPSDAKSEENKTDAPGLPGASALLTEEEALAAGILDYPIPVCKTYTALAYGSSSTEKIESDSAPKLESTHEAGDESRKKQSFLGAIKAFGHWLWDDTRSRKQRWLPSILIAAATAMTYGIFSMTESVIANSSQLIFSFAEIIGPVLIFGLVIFAIVFLISLCFRGRIFDFMLCLALSLLVCGYIQSTVFNAELGELMGQSVGWTDLGVPNVIFNLLFWLAVFAIIFIFGLLRKEKIRRFFWRFALFAPSLLIAVQLVALFSILPPVNEWQTEQPSGTTQVLSVEGLYDVSSNGNVLIFIVDMLDEDFIHEILAVDPHFFDNLDGFTRFTNNVSVYNMTFPSVVNLITDVPYDPSIPSEDYIANAYTNQRSFITDIRSQGFHSSLYAEPPYVYTREKQLEGLADNLDDGVFGINYLRASLQLFRLTLLKNAPLALKFPFWLHPDILSYRSIGVKVSGADPYWGDDPLFYHKLVNDGLRLTNEPQFTYYHLNGSHSPWIMDANAQYVEKGAPLLEQTMGCFHILNEYFEQMKRLGIYEDATIIITGDHPVHHTDGLLEKPMLVGLFVKPSGSAGTPLQYNNAPVSLANMRATCVEAAGGDPTPWGRTYFDVAEGERSERYYYNRYSFRTGQGSWDYLLAKYRIVGDARDWNNWELVEQIKVASGTFIS